MNNPIKILIADDHAVVRSGIRSLLEDEAHIHIVGEAADGFEALEKIEKLRPDILLLDLAMPQMSGFEVAQAVSAKHNWVKIIVFSMHNDHEYIMRSVEMGARGYLLKDTSKEEILRALTVVANGSKY
ncbi:MAG: response regulator transcription factor, partial [Spirosomaceae bacterium]|nr:response regulator transcription factor [Spirosomataceae bacterium]